MSGFELSREHEEFRRTVREFATAEIAPHAAAWDEKHHVPIDVIAKMGDLGLFGLTSPEEYGGAGEDGDFISLCVAIEEVGRVDQGLGITLESAVGLGINPILNYGTDEQRATWLPNLVTGRALAGFGLTEPASGSAAAATQTRAELRDGEWVVNGSKQFITNSGSAITSLVTVTARTGEQADGRAEISSIIIPADVPGFTAEPSYNKLGWHSSDTHPLSFDDVRVPEANLLGERGKGYAQFLATLDDGRVAIAALAVGCIQACLDMSVEYAGERTSFGKPIGTKQGVAFKIADLQVMVEAARLLTYKAAALKDAGAAVAAFKQAASIAKLYATESAVTATRIATQVFGGYGFMEEYPVARFYRDAKVLEIGEGTSEIQRILIARGLGLPVE
jgi:short/branched chain acyl-CoA dehydrogenase